MGQHGPRPRKVSALLTHGSRERSSASTDYSQYLAPDQEAYGRGQLRRGLQLLLRSGVLPCVRPQGWHVHLHLQAGVFRPHREALVRTLGIKRLSSILSFINESGTMTTVTSWERQS